MVAIDLFKILVVANWSDAQKMHFHGHPRKVIIEVNGNFPLNVPILYSPIFSK